MVQMNPPFQCGKKLKLKITLKLQTWKSSVDICIAAAP